MDIPHEVTKAQPCGRGEQLGVVDQHEVVIVPLGFEEPPGRPGCGQPITANGPGQGDRPHPGHLREATVVCRERRGIRHLPAIGEEGVDLAVPDSGVFRVVNDGDNEDARPAHVGPGVGGSGFGVGWVGVGGFGAESFGAGGCGADSSVGGVGAGFGLAAGFLGDVAS